MSVIGTFTQTKDGGWTGSIQTLTINTKIRLVPNDNRDSEKAPVFRVYAGQTHIGDAWAARSNGKKPKNYLSIRIDDPSLPGPINAALFHADGGKESELVWRRRKV